MREKGVYPRTRKQSTGLFSAPCGWPCCSTPSREIKIDPKHELGAAFYAGEGGRTLTPLELVPKTSASAIPPLPQKNQNLFSITRFQARVNSFFS